MLCLQLLAHGEGHRGLVEGLVSGDRHLNLVSDSQQEQAALGLAQRHLSDDLVEALTKELLAHGADSGLTGLALHNLLVQVLTQTSHVNTRGLLVANILDEVLAIEGVYVHMYGKKETKPYRKIGHYTILGKNREDCISKMNQVRKHLRIEAID